MDQDRGRYLQEAFKRRDILPFVYCYPPRTCYVPDETPADLNLTWRRDALFSHDLNIYIHIPFCFYKCSFCNLFTITTRRDEDGLFDAYVDRLRSDLLELSDALKGRRVRTVFVGGGTPFSVGAPRLVRILESLAEVFPDWKATVSEVTVEGSPDSILAARDDMADLVKAGVNRISVGVQSFDKLEIKRAGRASAGPEIVEEAILALRTAGVRNIGLDLIVGLEGQTNGSFDYTLAKVIALRPETLSIYLISPRVGTGFERRNATTSLENRLLYKRLEAASDRLRDAGYVRESSVQFKLPNMGGLLHKQLYFGGMSILGLGAGARSYTAFTDYLTGGGPRTRDNIMDYIDRPKGYSPVSAGAIITRDESVRRSIILGLHGLDLRILPKTTDGRVEEPYASVLEVAIRLGLMKVENDRILFTEHGYIFRDLICWSLFSDEILGRHAAQGTDYTSAQRFPKFVSSTPSVHSSAHDRHLPKQALDTTQ
jgi:oxygen-independent coproporphyrinogen III oxidase